MTMEQPANRRRPLQRHRLTTAHPIIICLVFFILFFENAAAFTLTQQQSPCISQKSSLPLTTANMATIDDDLTTTTHTNLWTLDDLEDYAQDVGVVISWSTLGPGYRAVARAAHNESVILGYVEGFVRPSGQIQHLDKMELFSKQIKRARTEAPGSLDFAGVGIGLGTVLGYRCLLFGAEKGCKMAEFLAIDDEEFQHKRLVRYYQSAGFQIVKYVGDDFQDIPDRLVWGGCGTLMRENMDVLLSKWTRLMTLMRKKAGSRKADSE